MKKSQKLLLALAIAACCGMSSASAQIYVRIRPIAPIVVRTEQPSPRHVWVGEDWEERDGHYEHIGGHWAEPPRDGYHYNQGHWDHTNKGHRWHEGGWHEDGDRKNGGHR